MEAVENAWNGFNMDAFFLSGKVEGGEGGGGEGAWLERSNYGRVKCLKRRMGGVGLRERDDVGLLNRTQHIQNT